MFNFNYVIKLKFDDEMYKMIDFILVIWVFYVDYIGIIFVYGKFIYLIIFFFFGILIVLD